MNGCAVRAVHRNIAGTRCLRLAHVGKSRLVRFSPLFRISAFSPLTLGLQFGHGAPAQLDMYSQRQRPAATLRFSEVMGSTLVRGKLRHTKGWGHGVGVRGLPGSSRTVHTTVRVFSIYSNKGFDRVTRSPSHQSPLGLRFDPRHMDIHIPLWGN